MGATSGSARFSTTTGVLLASRPSHLGFNLLVAVVNDLGEAEVSQLNYFLAVHEEHVVGLYVAVQHLLLLVQVVHAQAELTDRKKRCITFRQVFRDDEKEQGSQTRRRRKRDLSDHQLRHEPDRSCNFVLHVKLPMQYVPLG